MTYLVKTAGTWTSAVSRMKRKMSNDTYMGTVWGRGRGQDEVIGFPDIGRSDSSRSTAASDRAYGRPLKVNI